MRKPWACGEPPRIAEKALQLQAHAARAGITGKTEYQSPVY